MNVRLKFLIICLCCWLVACSDSPESRMKEAGQYLKSAEQLFKQGQLRAALVQAKNVIQLAPDSAQGYLQIARIYNQIGYYSEVEKLIGNKLSLMPELGYQLAYAHYQRKKYRSALDTLNLAAVPQDQSVRLLKALCYLQLGEDVSYEMEVKQIKAASEDDGYLVFAQAKGAQARENFIDAESLYKQVSRTAPLYIEALTDLSGLYISQSRFDAAEQRLTEALSITTNADTLTVEKARILTMMVQMLVQQGRSGEAYTYQKILANANPQLDFMKNRFDEALDLYAKGDIERARKNLIDLHQSFPNNSNVTTLLGVIAFQMGNDEEAEGYLSDVIDPETATPGLIQASSLLKTRNNKIDDAIALLKDAVDAQPRSAQLLATYGLALLQKDPTDKAGAIALEKSIVMDPAQQRLRLALAERHYRLNEKELALAQLEAAFRNSPLDKLIQQTYFTRLALVSGDKAVQTEIDTLKKKYPNEAGVILIDAWWMTETNNLTAAEKLLRSKISAFEQKDALSAYLLLADVYRQQKKPDAARKTLEDYLRQAPQSTQIYNNWLSLVEASNQQAAAQFLEELQALDATAWQPDFYLGWLKAKTNQWDDAITNLDSALQKTPLINVRQQVIGLYNGYGFQLLQSADLEKSQSIFLKSLGLDADDRTALYYYVQIALKRDQLSEAKKIVDQSVASNQASAMNQFLLGMIKEKEGASGQALNYFEAAWKQEAFDLYAEKLYGIYQSQQNPNAIELLIENWQARLPRSTQALLLSAMLKQEKGDAAAAVESYKKLLSVMPNNLIALNNLAWLLKDTDIKEAEVLAEKAYGLAKSSPDVIDTYVQVLLQNQKKQEAIQVLQQASIVLPDNLLISNRLLELQAQ